MSAYWDGYSAGDDSTRYCEHCSHLAQDYVVWPCPTAKALGVTE